MQLAAETGRAYELTEARRFTHPWERAASLQLREGDEAALQTYRKHGRIIDAGTDRAGPRLTRHEPGWPTPSPATSPLLIVDTNEQADRLSAQLRAELVRLGRVEEHGVPLGRQGTLAGRRRPRAGPAATAGTSKATKATAAARSTARPTASSTSATTAA